MALVNIDPLVFLRILAASEGEGEKFSLMQIHPGTIIWTLIIFAVLLVVLGKLIWKPILKAVGDRETKIREALEKADKAQADAQKALDGQKDLVEKQRKESAEFMARAKDEARRSGEELMEKARRESVEQTERARRQIEEEKNRAIEEVRTYAVDLALLAAGHLLGKTMDEDSQRGIVKDYIDNLPSRLEKRH
jgi:F-type H+-transporting ATPase subunit b